MPFPARRPTGRSPVPAPAAAALVAAAALWLSGCAPAAGGVELPPTGATPDYQLGGAYDPAEGVGIVARDRTAEPAEGRYSICYVNGFQTQPGELGAWPEGTVLERDGAPVIDENWPDEALLDTSSSRSREAILEVVGPWIDGCADAGFDAVEFDNLDTFTRSAGALSFADNLELAAAFVTRAHAAGLAAGQKNAPEQAAELRERAGFDFAVVEGCSAYDECDAYREVYGDLVIAIEYTDSLPRPFAELCRAEDAPRSLVLRDRALAMPGTEGYAFETCAD